MKWIGISMVWLSCIGYGFLVDSNQRKRVGELDRLVQAFELLKGEITYRLTPLGEALMYVADFASKETAILFSDFATLLQERKSTEVKSMWQQVLLKNREHFHLKEEDYLLLLEFGEVSGGMDKDMQMKSLERIIEKLKKEHRTNKEKYERTTHLNKYLGVLVGACISIFLI